MSFCPFDSRSRIAFGLGAALALVLAAPAAAAPPANDAFGSPTVLTGTSASKPGDNSQAEVALQAGEPDHAEFSAGDAGRSVWFRWEAPAGAGPTTISLCGSRDAADSVVAVYTGASVNALTLVPGAEDDDGCGLLSGPSEVSFTPVAGTTYRIAVADWDSGRSEIKGTFQLDLQPRPSPPANDAFANPEPLSAPTDTYIGTNLRATTEPGEPDHAAEFGGDAQKSVWFSWEAPGAGVAQVSLCDSGETDDSVIAVYTGPAVNALDEPAIEADDDGCGEIEGPSRLAWDAEEGERYMIAVADWDAESPIGNRFELDFTWTSDGTDPPDPPDENPPETTITGSADFAKATSFGLHDFHTEITQPLSIAFASDAADLDHFECLVDGAVVAADCDSPWESSNPPSGVHTFAVRAVDESGNADPSAAERVFTVDGTPPGVSFAEAPADGSTITDATPRIAVGTEDTAKLVCRLDGAPLEWCPGRSFDLIELGPGLHTIEIFSIDSAGNVGGPATRSFTVDDPYDEPDPPDEPTQACLDAMADLADAEAVLVTAAEQLARAKERLAKAKKKNRRNKARKARSKLERAKGDHTRAENAVSAATAEVEEHCT